MSSARDRSPIDRKRKNSMSGIRVFVSNLPTNIKWMELKDLFRDEIGEVAYAELYNDDSGRQNGCGLVEFNSMEATRRAIKKMDQFDWKGKALNVREAVDGDRDQYSKSRDGGSRPSKVSRSSKTGINARRVFVSNLPYEMKWQEVKDLFREHVGDVAFVELFDDESGRPRGCGIMEFDSETMAEKAIKKMNKYEIMQRKISVQEALDVERDKYGYPIKSGSGSGGSRGGAPSQRGGAPPQRGGGAMQRSSGGPVNYGNTYGLSVEFLESLGIEGPLHTNLYIGNLPYNVDEKKLRDIFRMAGKIVGLELNKDKDGKSRGFALLEYSHPVEAVQAISMFNNQKLYERYMGVRFDNIPPKEEELPRHLPEGLAGVGMGLGDGGKPLTNVAKNLSQNSNSGNNNAPELPNSDIVVASAKTLAELTPALAILAQQMKMNVAGQGGNQMPVNPIAAAGFGVSNSAANFGNQSVMAGGGYQGNMNSSNSNSRGYDNQPGFGGSSGYGGTQGSNLQAYSGGGSQRNYDNSPSAYQGDRGGSSRVAPAPNQGLGARTESWGNSAHSRLSDSQSAPRVKADTTYDTIIVRNLPHELTWQALSASFEICGEVKNCIIKEPGMGLIRFSDPRAADRALDYHNTTKWGRIVDVRYF